MTDNRISGLLEAAMHALAAITDVGVDMAQRDGSGDSAGMAYLMDRRAEAGKNLDERLEVLHGMLQAAHTAYADEIENMDITF